MQLSSGTVRAKFMSCCLLSMLLCCMSSAVCTLLFAVFTPMSGVQHTYCLAAPAPGSAPCPAPAPSPAPSPAPGPAPGEWPICDAGGRQYYVLSLHRDTPLDQQAAVTRTSAAQGPAPAPAQSAHGAGRDDGFAGFTLKGGKGGGAKKEPVVPQQGNIAGAAYLLHKVPALAHTPVH